MRGESTHKILELLKRGDKAMLEKIYVENRETFINFSKKFGISEFDAADVYQDAIIVFRENAMNGKINSLESSISTYLFAIGKYKIFQTLRANSNIDLDSDLELDEKNIEFDVNLFDEKLTKEQRVVAKYFKMLGERCKEILTLFYYQGYTLGEIAVILEYSTKEVLKSSKSRCIQKLKNLINKRNG
ncbi:MAG: sigma-70 family RNA polymerase sigma factor [Bacteroidota bacterium]